jgi:hypothetical protein
MIVRSVNPTFAKTDYRIVPYFTSNINLNVLDLSAATIQPLADPSLQLSNWNVAKN